MLSSKNRLRQQKDFDNVYKRGRAVHGPLFNLRFVANSLDLNRYGIVVSKKTEKLATRRNNVKRRVRAAVRDSIGQIANGRDIVILVKKAALASKPDELKREIYSMLKKAKLLNF